MKWREYQDSVAEGTDHWSAKRYGQLALNVLRYLPEIHGKCLDVGCGEGLITDALRSRRNGLAVYGTDISPVRLARAAKRVVETDFVAGDLLALPWRNESFDSVVCCEVLEHIPDHESALMEIFRILKKTGLLLVTVPDRQELSWVVCPECGTRVYKDGHLRSFSPDDLRYLFAPHGEVLTLTPIGKKWRQIRRRIAAALIPGKKYKGKYLICVVRKR